MTRPLVAVALLAPLALSACGAATSARGAETAALDEGVTDAVSEVVVFCAANTIDVSSATVMANARGVQLRVSSTMPPGSYVTYSSLRYGMGEPLLPGEADANPTARSSAGASTELNWFSRPAHPTG